MKKKNMRRGAHAIGWKSVYDALRRILPKTKLNSPKAVCLPSSGREVEQRVCVCVCVCAGRMPFAKHAVQKQKQQK